MKSFLSLLMVAWLFHAEAISYPGGPEVGQVAPALKNLRWLQAPPEAAAGWPTGKVVVLEFWAISCLPCVEAIPHLNELADQFKDRPVQFIAVTADEESTIHRFLEKTPIKAWIGMGTEAGLGETTPYRVAAIPHTVIIDAHGRIAAIVGPLELSSGLIDLCLAGRQLPGERAGQQLPGVIPDQDRSEKAPLFQIMIRPATATLANRRVDTWSANGLTLQPGQLKQAIARVFNVPWTRIVAKAELPKESYDFYIALPAVKGSPQRKTRLEVVFAEAVETTFGLTVEREMLEMDVLVLKTNATSPERLSRSANASGRYSSGPGEVNATDKSMSALAEGLEYGIAKPVLDETGLTNRFSFDVRWDQKDFEHPNQDGMIAAVSKLGLDLVPAKRPVESIVVRKATPP